MNIGIFIYEHAEVLDFAGPFEVFSTVARFLKQDSAVNIFLIGETGHTISARGGFSVNPTYGFLNHPKIDLLIIAGGIHNEEIKNKSVLHWIKKTAGDAKYVASVCTGAFLLAHANIITQQKVTTHWEDIPALRLEFPSLTVVEHKRWIDEGNIITSGGISAGIDMSLFLVSKLFDKHLAIKTAKQMEFDWTLEN